MSRGAVRAAEDAVGHLWMIDSEARIWRKQLGVWEQMPGLAVELATGGDESVWVLGTDFASNGFGVYRWTGTTWDRYPNPDALVAITVDPAGTIWGVNSQFQIFRRMKGDSQFQGLPGAAVDISAGRADAAWVLGTNRIGEDFAIHQWNGVTWVQEPETPSGRSIAASADGTVMVSNFRNEIYYRGNGKWPGFGVGAAYSLSSDAMGNIWAVGTNELPGGFGMWKRVGNSWQMVEGPGTKAKEGQEAAAAISLAGAFEHGQVILRCAVEAGAAGAQLYKDLRDADVTKVAKTLSGGNVLLALSSDSCKKTAGIAVAGARAVRDMFSEGHGGGGGGRSETDRHGRERDDTQRPGIFDRDRGRGNDREGNPKRP